MQRIAEQDDAVEMSDASAATCVAARPPIDLPPMNTRSFALQFAAHGVDDGAITRHELGIRSGTFRRCSAYKKLKVTRSRPRSLSAASEGDHERMPLRRSGSVRENQRRSAAPWNAPVDQRGGVLPRVTTSTAIAARRSSAAIASRHLIEKTDDRTC